MLASLFDASAWTALIAAVVAAIASILFLRSRNFFFDSLALAVTEIGVIVLAAGIVTGAIATRAAGGLWWTWDTRLTAGLVCWLLYVPYLMLRNAIEEPSRRASSAAVVSIFAFFDLPVALLAVRWWLSSHATARGVAPAEWWEILPLTMVAAALSWMRLTREQRRRAADAARRNEQTI